MSDKNFVKSIEKNNIDLFRIKEYVIIIRDRKKKKLVNKIKFAKFIKKIYISFSIKSFYIFFKSVINLILKNNNKKYYLKIIFLLFFFKNSYWNLIHYEQSNIELLNCWDNIFNKFNIYLDYYYRYYFIVNTAHYCLIKTIFFLRNLTLIFQKKKIFKFFTVGLIVKNKKNKKNINFQIVFIKMFFLNIMEHFSNNINIFIMNFSKKLNLFFHYLNYYLSKNNIEVYKYNFLKIRSINFKNKIKYESLKGPKKPSKKKFIIKKKKTYYF